MPYLVRPKAGTAISVRDCSDAMSNAERADRPMRRMLRADGYAFFEHLTDAAQRDPALEVHFAESKEDADALLEKLARAHQDQRKKDDARRKATEQKVSEQAKRAAERVPTYAPVIVKGGSKPKDEKPEGENPEGKEEPKRQSSKERKPKGSGDLLDLDAPKKG